MPEGQEASKESQATSHSANGKKPPEKTAWAEEPVEAKLALSEELKEEGRADSVKILLGMGLAMASLSYLSFLSICLNDSKMVL